MQNYLNLNKLYKPLVISIFLALLDNYVKYYVRLNNIQETVIIENFLTIDLKYNTGIAFGLFSEQTNFTFVLSLIVFFWLLTQFNNLENNTIEFYSLALILGGAIGNLGERGYNLITFNDGKVTDFIELLFIPSFNFADSYITIGICMLILSELKNK